MSLKMKVGILSLTLFALGCGKSKGTTSSTSPLPSLSANCAGQGCLDASLTLQAQSKTSLSATLSLGTDAGQVEAARYLYTLFNGPSDQFQISGEPADGLLGVLNSVTSILSTGLQANDYANCAAVPTTGSLTIQEGNDTYAMTFGTSTRSLPSSFATAATLTKQIRVLKNGSLHLIAELACGESTVVSSYFRLTTDLREIEVYAQTDSASNAAQIEFYSVASNENFAVRFVTDNGSDFNLWITRPSLAATPVTLGVRGQRNLSLAHVRTHSGTTSDTTTITSSAHETCLDLATDSSSTACTTNSVAVTAPAATAPLKSNQTYAFNLASILSMDVTDLE